jgi:hypothetical protein
MALGFPMRRPCPRLKIVLAGILTGAARIARG